MTPIDNPGMGQGEPNPQATPSPTPPSEPTPFKLSNDSLIQLEGQDKPVKFSDYTRGFQSTATKASQEKARIAAEYEKAQKALEQRERDYRDLQSRMDLLSRTQATDKPDELIEAIQSLPYLDGQSAARVIKQIRQELQGYGKNFEPYNQAIALLYAQFQRLNQVVEQLNSTHQNASFESKIRSMVKDLGFPEEPELLELAQELYLAYEGDDLDAEFPAILQKRLEQIEAFIRRRDKQKIDAAKAQRFTPSSGGLGAAQKPLNLYGKSTAEIADMLYPPEREET